VFELDAPKPACWLRPALSGPDSGATCFRRQVLVSSLTMTISVQVPDALAKALHLDGPELNRRALEALALDGYRTGELSRGQVSELLDLELNETMGFLKAHGCTHGITMEEFERESQALRELLGR